MRERLGPVQEGVLDAAAQQAREFADAVGGFANAFASRPSGFWAISLNKSNETGPVGGCTGPGTRFDTRASSSGPKPISNVAPSGRAISSRTTSPIFLPRTRRTISPFSQPKVSAW